jgi:hypothetical protein
MPAHLILLDFITGTTLGEEYRSLTFSLCSFLHSPVTSSLLGTNKLLNTVISLHTLTSSCVLISRHDDILSASEVELSIEKLKSHKSPGIDQIPIELIKAGGRIILCEIHKLIFSIWNKEELPEDGRSRS